MVRLAYALFASAVASVSNGAPTASTAARSASYTGAPLGRRIGSPRVANIARRRLEPLVGKCVLIGNQRGTIHFIIQAVSSREMEDR